MKMIIIYSTEFYLINLLQTNSIFLDSPLYSAYFNKLYFTTYFIFILIFHVRNLVHTRKNKRSPKSSFRFS